MSGKLKLAVLMIGGLAAVALFSAPAQAQGSVPPEPPASVRGGSGGAGIGVGASQTLSGLHGAQVVYDQPIWHIEGLLAFDNRDGAGANPPRITLFTVNVSGWYHLHQGSSSDFSIGGGVGIVTQSGQGNSLTATVFDPGVLVRAFVTPNVAIHARAGFEFAFGDAVAAVSPHFGLDGQVFGAFGFTYFFR
jgi:hypothetical protein